ncbi:hypothetical protein [Paenibacillus sp. YN15]|uniref:hypothetical protein n=1 Tax=Paenibacillus sp. YN15 TaxID=1742774 RepID=UPI0011BD5BEB|nr:hypothetical protein [Paenibacillus sp. YN15]
MEILSASYPAFIDDSDLLYRNIGEKKYRDRLGVSDECKLEQAVEAGYLYRDEDGSFYIVPAAPIGDFHFVSVRELDIIRCWGHVLKKKERLFDWSVRASDGALIQKKLEGYADQIKKLDEAIYAIRQREEVKGTAADLSIEEVFTSSFPFTIVFPKIKSEVKKAKAKYEAVIDDQCRNLGRELKSRIKEPSLQELLNKMVERWGLKLRMHAIYEGLEKPWFKNKASAPYQKAVSFDAQGNSVSWIGHVSFPRAGAVKGMLFNSTNAGSKRGHYLIGQERKDAERIKVPDQTIAGYNSAFGRMRLDEANKPSNNNKPPHDDDNNKAFYDLFNILSKTNCKYPKIVFYKQEWRKDLSGNQEQVLVVGRTPYFRVRHHYQLNDLRGTRKQGGIDYASALFGYIASERGNGNAGEQEGYKSRLRFSPLRVCGNIGLGRIEKFLLAKPQATAEAMYLKPHGNEASSYEGHSVKRQRNSESIIVAPQLRGRKYYHVLSQPLKLCGQVPDNMTSQRYVYDPSFHLKGTLHFKNLTEAELGLLLLAMDISLLPDASSFNPDKKPYFEQIGGAKAYGYGKVQFSIEEIQLEQKGSSFESLIVQPYKQAEVSSAHYVAAYLRERGGEAWLKRVHMKRYVKSKLVKESFDKNHVDWTNIDEKRKIDSRNAKGGGYLKSWVLEYLEE